MLTPLVAMIRFGFSLVVALFAVTGGAQSQLPPPLDATRYPELAAMRAWLEKASPEAQHCARTGGLFLDANTLYRELKSEPKTIEALVQKHADKLAPEARQRLRAIATHVTAMAAGFATLDPDSAPVAYSQLCIGRAQKGGELSPAALQARFDASQKCELAHSTGSLDRKECVAKAFRVN